ncbi:hypothetical protein B0F90DRAFT_1628752 [Multifurca ochricompacta]|uniref:Rad4-domain-containing protein n=1 Tax=Multifurca ochricompacta TaxID=376703 RepID=A0AAD4QNS4_9AGAM|nr:hypothetical protein B0F90DRAFT_1628752 [Multifurca ochricompacta]
MSTEGKVEPAYGFSDSSEDELDWEEVAVPQALDVVLDDQPGPSTRPNIEVTIETFPAQGKDVKQKKPPGGISHAERLHRIDCHKVHTVALIANAWARNRWINDDLLQARLLSLTPFPIQNSFAMIHKSRIPEAVRRGYLFEQAVSRLALWWADTFFTVKSIGHIRSRPFEDVQRVLLSSGLIDINGKGKGKAFPPGVDPLEDLFEDGEVEIVRSAKSLMKHALMRSGSRDVSSQLFTALCRALGIPARLVVSLQSVPWQTNVGRPKTPAKSKGSNSKGKDKAVELRDAGDDSESMEEVDVSQRAAHSSGDDDMQVAGDPLAQTPSGKVNDKGKTAYGVKLRKTKNSGRKLGSLLPSVRSDPLTTPPVFWTEVFSRPDGRWLPVDPIRAIVNKRKVFDPTPTSVARRSVNVDNRMVYVLAVEEDGYMRDVTPRYARQYSAKVAKVQSGGRGRREWWARVLGMVARPYKLNRDDVEDDELAVNQFTEGMPTTLSGFKDHPFYVLERHLLRDQIILVDAPELGKFRGESVYPRSQVLQLKAAENWMRHGRIVRPGEQPLKHIKQRVATLNRRRELEIRAHAEGANSNDDVMQGLYAEKQTEIYAPPPVIDGKIPKNNFGNIDLYTPSMLPAGAVYIPRTQRRRENARQLGFDYAEAVTSFEFRKGKAFPVISGIVVAVPNEEVILEAYWEAEHVAAQKEQEKRQQAVINRWTKLVQGLRIRQRIREQYGGGGSNTLGKADDGNDNDNDDEGVHGDGGAQSAGGGFITSVEDVVQPYNLPRPIHVVFSSPPRSPAPLPSRSDPDNRTHTPEPMLLADPTPNLLLNDDDSDQCEGVVEDADRAGGSNSSTTTGSSRKKKGMPKSMAELAAEAAAAAETDLPTTSSSPSIAAADANLIQEAVALTTVVITSGSTQRRLGQQQQQQQPKSKKSKKSGSRRPRTSQIRVVNGRAHVKRARKQRHEDKGEDDPGASASASASASVKGVVAVTVAVPASDRVLRARKDKSTEQLAREREHELAVKRAIAS